MYPECHFRPTRRFLEGSARMRRASSLSLAVAATIIASVAVSHRLGRAPSDSVSEGEKLRNESDLQPRVSRQLDAGYWALRGFEATGQVDDAHVASWFSQARAETNPQVGALRIAALAANVRGRVLIGANIDDLTGPALDGAAIGLCSRPEDLANVLHWKAILSDYALISHPQVYENLQIALGESVRSDGRDDSVVAGIPSARLDLRHAHAMAFRLYSRLIDQRSKTLGAIAIPLTSEFCAERQLAKQFVISAAGFEELRVRVLRLVWEDFNDSECNALLLAANECANDFLYVGLIRCVGIQNREKMFASVNEEYPRMSRSRRLCAVAVVHQSFREGGAFARLGDLTRAEEDSVVLARLVTYCANDRPNFGEMWAIAPQVVGLAEDKVVVRFLRLVEGIPEKERLIPLAELRLQKSPSSELRRLLEEILAHAR